MAHRPATILLTRPRADAERFASRLRDMGVTAPIEISPLVEIVPTNAEVDFTGFKGAVFSSRNAVAMCPAQELPAWCVGRATAEAAAAKGWRAIAAGGDAEALYARILADAPKGPLLHLRGDLSWGNLAARLSAAGIKTEEVVVYAQVAQALSTAAKSLLCGQKPVIVPLFSANAAQLFARQLRAFGTNHEGLHVVAISESVRATIGDLPCEQVVLAAKKEAAAMAEAITRLLDAG